MGNSIQKVKDSVVTTASHATKAFTNSVKDLFSNDDDKDDFSKDPSQQRFIGSSVLIALPKPMSRYKDQVKQKILFIQNIINIS